MNRNIFALPLALPIALAAGLSVGGGPAVAQQSNKPIEEIRVEAPRVVKSQIGRTKNRSELISLTRRVSYSDLNLALHADVMELQKRINDTAKEACDQLAKMYPNAEGNTPDCVKQAVSGAETQANKAIAAASSKNQR